MYFGFGGSTKFIWCLFAVSIHWWLLEPANYCLFVYLKSKLPYASNVQNGSCHPISNFFNNYYSVVMLWHTNGALLEQKWMTGLLQNSNFSNPQILETPMNQSDWEPCTITAVPAFLQLHSLRSSGIGRQERYWNQRVWWCRKISSWLNCWADFLLN